MCRTACWPSVGLLVEFTRFEVIQVLSPVFPANCKLIDSNPRHRKLPEARDRCHSRQVHRSGHGSGVVHGRPILHEGCGVLRQRGRPRVRSLFSSFESKPRLRIKTHKILSNVILMCPSCVFQHPQIGAGHRQSAGSTEDHRQPVVCA